MDWDRAAARHRVNRQRKDVDDADKVHLLFRIEEHWLVHAALSGDPTSLVNPEG